MAKTSQVPTFVRLGNVLTTTLLRAGFKLVGPGDYPMYLPHGAWAQKRAAANYPDSGS